PVLQLLRLERYNMAGSIYDRTDAIIIGLQHLIKTGGIGIGLGGAYNILDGELETARSMHNIFVQTLVELGVIFLVVYILYLFRLYFNTSILNWFKWCFFLLLPLSSSISSGGILSNYMFWGIVIYAFLLNKVPWETHTPETLETAKETVSA
ncbi:MAG: hypothetical protein J6S58_02400, partial [Lentisphaeria bacterium]|nr:hypothetical protein [Lentisphaeria bacterium]